MERYAAEGMFEDFFELFHSTFKYFSKDSLQETLGKLFIHLLTFILQKEYSVVLFNKSEK